MSQNPPTEMLSIGTEFDVMQIPDSTAIGERFLEGFTTFLEEKKREAVVEVLQADLPKLAEDEAFIQKVMLRLGKHPVDEKRFVFLSINPKFMMAQDASATE